MRIYLVRHGKTDNNEKDIFNDENDVPLNEEGRKQADLLATRLKGEDIEIVLSSKKLRAIQTAEAIRAFQPKVKKIETNDEIRQRKAGIFEGRPTEDMKKKAAERGVPLYLYRPEGGESFEDRYVQAKKVYDWIISTYKGKKVLVVGHQGFNKVFLGAAMHLGIPEAYALKQDNCCLNILDVGKFRVAKAIVLNDVDHLQP